MFFRKKSSEIESVKKALRKLEDEKNGLRTHVLTASLEKDIEKLGLYFISNSVTESGKLHYNLKKRAVRIDCRIGEPYIDYNYIGSFDTKAEAIKAYKHIIQPVINLK